MTSKIAIIANGSAKGVAHPSERQAFERMARAALGDSFVTVTFIDPNTDIAALVHAAQHEGATMIVAGGGDGTVNAIAALLAASDAVLGVLPMGTLNHFAKDLNIPLEIEPAIQLLANGNIVNIDIGQVNDRIFVNNSGLGLYPDMVSNREKRQKKGLAKWPAAIAESLRALVRYRLFSLRINVDNRSMERRTPAVFIGNNEYSMEGTLAAKRHSISSGQLALYVPHASSRSRLLWFALRAFFGNPKADGEFDRVLTDRFVINSRHRHLHVSLDGEVCTMQPPLEYASRPGALRVLVPHEDRNA